MKLTACERGLLGWPFSSAFVITAPTFAAKGGARKWRKESTVPCVRILMGGKNGRNAKIEFEV